VRISPSEWIKLVRNSPPKVDQAGENHWIMLVRNDTEGGDLDKLGRGDVWKGQIDSCLHQNHVFVVRPDQNRILPEFLSALTSSAYGKRYFLSCAKQTTNLASINSTQLKAFPVLTPPPAEQQQIVAQLSSAVSQQYSNEAALQQLLQLKRGLTQDLLTGRVRVSVD
jgi:type I restriction enzyme, S subunit